MKTLFKAIALAMFCLAPLAEAKSYGGGGGGFRSSSSRSFSSSRSSYSAPASSVTKQSAAPSSNSYSKPSTSGSAAQTSTRPTSKVDIARYEAASKSGKAFTTREAAVADFKAKNANTSTYTSKYSTEPAQRPTHIPRTYNYQGRRVDVVYNQSYGGYGYWSGGGPGLGTWMMYDAISDAAMINTLMSRNNYYVGQPPARFDFWGSWVFALGLIALIVVIVIIFIAIVD